MRYRLLIGLLWIQGALSAQDISLALQKVPHLDPSVNAAAWQALKGTVVSFANSNTRYSKDRVPVIKQELTQQLIAWKGEKVHTQVVVYSNRNISSVKTGTTDLSAANGARIAKENISVGYLGYVMTDEFGNGCGHRNAKDFDSSLVADPINTNISSIGIAKNNVQPVWISVAVPANIPAGTYRGTINVNADKNYTLNLTVKVLDHVLTPPSEWSFNLDFWQHPAAVARVHNVALWSDAHFSLMKKYYTMLAKAGQKNITASIVNEPWGHQTYDDFPSLVKWTKKKEGTWSYDYSLFDKYVSFVMDCGINKRINCYSMVPWKIAFQYYDEKLGKDTVFTGEIGTVAYNEFWRPMLINFTQHLKDKGWFTITTIAMDERPMPAMQAVIKLLKEIDTGWKIALAGNYHPEIEKDIYDYCIASKWEFPDSTLKSRQQQQKLSTWYTCCTEKYPNGFTFSPPAEHVWIGWYTAAKNMEGYLRWAYNSWTKDPVNDSRFVTWPAGDTYQVYPGPMSSIRFEKMIEGIQDFEKIRILRKEYQLKGETAKLEKLEAGLAAFEIKTLEKQSAGDAVTKAKGLINQ